jgi:apolipoprotein N-acyltransferase
MSRIALFAERLRKLTGRRRALTAIGLGLVSALAFPPFGAFPLLWLTFPALIFLLQGTVNMRQAFITGWSFAFGLLVLGLYWIAASMFVDIAQFWWAVPLAVAGLPAFLAIYYGVAAVLARRFGIDSFAGIIAFALCWFLADYVRGHLLTGFPWNLTGYAWARALPILQIASVIGIYGLTLITLAAVCLPACLADRKKSGRAALLASFLILALMSAWGVGRLSQASDATVPNVRLRLVQPTIKQADKWKRDRREVNFNELLDLSSAPGLRPVTHIIWPETASTFYLAEDKGHRAMTAAHVPDHGAILTGVIRREAGAGGELRYYNSLIAIDHAANVDAVYDKFHLVPYGEYIPFRSLLPLHSIAGIGLDFMRGDGPHSLTVPGLPPFSPLICYEAIFPGEVTDPHNRPQLLVNVTNDGWYGRTSGPYQHFAIARVRAIEEGIPLARAANTGISGIIDSYGRITARLDLGKSGFVDGDLPVPLPPTIFECFGELPLWLLFGALAMIAIFSRIRAEKIRK